MEQSGRCTRWMMDYLPFLVINGIDGLNVEPILPVPVRLRYLGACSGGKADLFENVMIEEEGQGFLKHTAQAYYVVWKAQTGMRDFLMSHQDTTIWITEYDPMIGLDWMYIYGFPSGLSGPSLEPKVVAGVFTGKESPLETHILYSDLMDSQRASRSLE